MKKLCLALACAFICSSVVMAQTALRKTAPAMPEKTAERIEKQMTERYSKMNSEQLIRRKEMVEKRLKTER